MKLDSFKNEMFSRDTVTERLSAILLEFTKKTVRDQLSLSQHDYEEILASHKMARDLVDKYFEMMKEGVEHRRANLVKYTDIKFISLGEDCFSRMLLTHWGLKPNAKLGEKSHPFDLAVHPVPSTMKLLETDFDDYLVTENLQFHEGRNTVSNRKLAGVHFNHEIGIKYAENDYQLLIDIYQKRIANFLHDIDTHNKLVFVLHCDPAAHNTALAINKLWSYIKTRWPQKDMKLLCVNTWPHGAGIDTNGRDIFLDETIKIVDTHYPYPGYIWHNPAHSLTDAGYRFEKELIGQITEIVDNWAGYSGDIGRISPSLESASYNSRSARNNIIGEKVKNSEFLIVQQVQRTEGLSLTAFAVGHPQENQIVVDNNLTVGGWVIGKTSLVDKIIISGGIDAEIPVNIHRPDIHLHFGDLIENLCPLIEGIPRCGFYQQISLDTLNVDMPLEITAALQDGSKSLLATISLSKEAATPGKISSPEPATAPSQLKAKSFLKHVGKKQVKKKKPRR